MKLSKSFLYQLLCCVACSKSVTSVKPPSFTPSQSFLDKPYKVTALLNGSTWFGIAYASKAMPVAGQSSCTTDRFVLGFSTDLPYDDSSPKRSVTGCSDGCLPTQGLYFQNIPLAEGKYDMASLNSCAGAGHEGAVRYVWLVGGDGVVKSYTSQDSKTGWIQVAKYDTTQNTVEGSFELSLSSKDGQVANFQKGAFKALIK